MQRASPVARSAWGPGNPGSTLPMTIGSSIVLMAVGAILKWAVTAHVSWINLQTAGTVLFVLGILGLVLSLLYTFVWSRQNRTTTTRTYVPRDEQTTRYE